MRNRPDKNTIAKAKGPDLPEGDGFGTCNIGPKSPANQGQRFSREGAGANLKVSGFAKNIDGPWRGGLGKPRNGDAV